MDIAYHERRLAMIAEGAEAAKHHDIARQARYKMEDESRALDRSSDDEKAKQGAKDRQDMIDSIKDEISRQQDTPSKRTDDKIAALQARLNEFEAGSPTAKPAVHPEEDASNKQEAAHPALDEKSHPSPESMPNPVPQPEQKPTPTADPVPGSQTL